MPRPKELPAKDKRKTITFIWLGEKRRPVLVEVRQSDNAATIYHNVTKAIGGRLPKLHFENEQGNPLTMSYYGLKEDKATFVRPRRDGDPQESTAKHGKLAGIVKTWALNSASDIFPEEYAPRVAYANRLKVQRGLISQSPADADAGRLLHPDEWPSTFVAALSKLAKATPNAHSVALGLLVKVVEAREITNDRNAKVLEFMTADVRRAFEIQKGRMPERKVLSRVNNPVDEDEMMDEIEVNEEISGDKVVGGDEVVDENGVVGEDEVLVAEGASSDINDGVEGGVTLGEEEEASVYVIEGVQADVALPFRFANTMHGSEQDERQETSLPFRH